MPGVVSNCVDYHLVVEGDDCEVVDAEYGITEAELLSWNTEVDALCNNLWEGYYICVGV